MIHELVLYVSAKEKCYSKTSSVTIRKNVYSFDSMYILQFVEGVPVTRSFVPSTPSQRPDSLMVKVLGKQSD